MRLSFAALTLLFACGDEDPTIPGRDAGVADAFVDAEPCPTVKVYPDLDGDGRYAPGSDARSLSVCTPDASLPGFVTVFGDCDDHDANRFRRICADLDGDGLEGVHCVGGEALASEVPCHAVVEWTPSPGPYDCDDSDPLLLDFAHRDRDGDGVGAGEQQCAPNSAEWSPYGSDCDDADATRSPFRMELFHDGVDSDCNGTDASDCAGGQIDFARTTDCLGTNLALGVLSCSSCFVYSSTFAVLNRGVTRVQTEVRIVALDEEAVDSMPFSFSLDLAPMELRELVTAGVAGRFELQLIDGTDCAPDDNVGYAPYGHCL
jgi:hypothetical protein